MRNIVLLLLLNLILNFQPVFALPTIKLDEDIAKIQINQNLPKTLVKRKFRSYKSYDQDPINFKRNQNNKKSRPHYQPRLGPMSFDLQVNPFRLRNNGLGLNLDLVKSYDFWCDHDLAKQSLQEDLQYLGGDLKYSLNKVWGLLSFLPYIEKQT